MHVQRVEALVSEKPVPIEKLDKQTWRITANGKVTVRYDTYWNDGGPFGTELNTQSAFINPAMICMYVPNRRNEEVQINLNDLPAGWSAASGAPYFLVSSFGALTVFTFGAGSAFPDLRAGGSGGFGGCTLARRISMPSCSLFTTMCEDPLPTLPLALASCSPLSTLSSPKSD